MVLIRRPRHCKRVDDEGVEEIWLRILLPGTFLTFLHVLPSFEQFDI